MFLAHISVSSLVLITFRSFSGLSEVLGKPRNARCPPFGNNNVSITSYNVINSRCEPQRKDLRTYYLPSKCHCHSFYSCEVMEGGGGGAESVPHPAPGKKNARSR